MDTADSLSTYYSVIKAESDANNAWSAEQAQKQMDWQEKMSSTAHQREVADLKAAGLNPILSAGGQGATTGSGAMASRSDANVEALYGLASKAFEAQIKQAEADKVSAKAISGSAGTSNSELSLSDTPVLDSAAADVIRKLTGASSGTSKAVVKKTREVLEDVMRTLGDKAAGAYGTTPEEGLKQAAADASAKLSGTYGRDHDATMHKVTWSGVKDAISQVYNEWKDLISGVSARQKARKGK